MLEENATLIAAINEKQNLEKYNECIEYVQRLQD